MKFAQLDEQGYVIAVTGGESAPPGSDWVAYPDEAPPHGVNKIRRIDGAFVLTGESWIPTPGYDLARAMAYPSVGDQLDTLWHSMDQGLLPKIPGFYDRIKAVKDANPKSAT